MKNNKLVAARKKAGLTQKFVAEKVGISVVSYQRIEYGQGPSLQTAFLIAEALNTTVDQLWGGSLTTG